MEIRKHDSKELPVGRGDGHPSRHSLRASRWRRLSQDKQEFGFDPRPSAFLELDERALSEHGRIFLALKAKD